MKIKLAQFVYSFRGDLKLLLSISFGIFLFVLFFQPVSLEQSDFNSRLLIEAGLAAIVFVVMVFVRFFVRLLIQKYDQSNPESGLSSFLGGFLMLALSSVAFAFYLKYVGQVSISFYTMIKIILICLAPPVVLNQYDVIRELKEQNAQLLQENENIPLPESGQKEELAQSIIFTSENSSENLNLPLTEVVFIKSADNYVEIGFLEGNLFRKKLLRNTLKNIEHQLRPYSNFMRCHRICIVNLHFVEKLNRNYGNHWLKLKGCEERIPISLQYVMKIKEAL
ncbi:MAG: LytTR family DNA-binding domain-containing protein [Prolixibacteraceae bacterium]